MLSVNELRNGTFFQEQGQIFQVLAYEHIKMGRGSASVKIKIKNLRNGAITQKGYNSTSKVDNATLLKKQCKYLYKDSQNAYFMDSGTFEQFPLPLDKIGTQALFLKEGMDVSVSFFEGEPLVFGLPIKMEFSVSETAPSVRGNTETNIFKEAVLENSAKVKVPLFIKVGDRVIVDTRTSEYVERAS